MQNICIEPGLMTFQPEWFSGNPDGGLPGCLDHNRKMGELPKIEGAQWMRTGGFDPNPGLSENAKYWGLFELAFDKRLAEPRTYHVIRIARGRDTIEHQADIVVETTEVDGLAKMKVEANAANQWLLQIHRVVAATKRGLRIEPHYTTVANKPDPDVGIPSMAGIVRNGLLRLPYGDAHSKAMTDLFISECVQHPMALTSDLLMSCWFALLAAREIVRVLSIGVLSQYIPPWARDVHESVRALMRVER
jgi:hypothetical protein